MKYSGSVSKIKLRRRFIMQRKNSNTIMCCVFILCLMSLPALADPPIPIDPRHRTNHLGSIIRDIRPIAPEVKVSEITYFQINKGASVTTREVVGLNYKIVAPGQSNNVIWSMPTHYRVSQGSSFYGAEWKPYNNHISYNLGGNDNSEKIVYFQVARIPSSGDRTPITSNIICDSIELRKRKEFRLGGRDVYAMGQVYGFTSTSSTRTNNSVALIDYKNQMRGHFLAMNCYGRTFNDPAQCDFTLFDGKNLKEGWIFKSVHFFTRGCEGDGLGFTVGEKPVNDSHKIRFQLGLHSDAGKGCEVVITNITLEDPGNGEWTDAFR